MTTRAKTPRISPGEVIKATSEAADQSVEAAVIARDAALAAHKADVSAAKAAVIVAEQIEKSRPAPADPRDDVSFERLAEAASTWAQRLNPLRNRWPELSKIDGRLAELDQQQQQQTSERLAALHERRQRGPREHEAALASWIGGGQKGLRPEAKTVALDKEIEDVRAEIAAFDHLRGQVLGERVAYVARHRKRLVSAADKETAGARDTYLALVDQLEVARQELIASRATSVWASLFPSESLVSQPATHELCGGLRKPIEAHLPGVRTTLPAPSLFGLLRDDATHLSTVSTVEQAAAMQSVTTGQLTGRVAEWGGSDEDNERIAKEKREAVARYRREWGHDPA